MKKGRTRTNDPVGMRNRMLDAAMTAFQSGGYTATSTTDVMRAAGVTGGALHHHFPTKKGLALAVIGERVAQEVLGTWVQPLRKARRAAPAIVATFSGVIDALEAQGEVRGCPIGNLALELSLADDDLRAALADQYGQWRDAITERLERDLQEGRAQFAARDPRAFANVVVALFSGAMSIAKAEQRTSALRDCLAQLRVLMAADLPRR